MVLARLEGADVQPELPRAQMGELARTLFGDLADRDDFDRLLDMAAATIRGLALLDTLQPGAGRGKRQWAYARPQLVELFTRS